MEDLSRYNDYFSNVLRHETDNQYPQLTFFEELQAKTDELIQALKFSGDLKIYRKLINALAIVITALVLAIIYKYGFYWNFVVVLAFIAFYLVYRKNILSKYAVIVNSTWIKDLDASPENSLLPQKIDYIDAIIELKAERLKMAQFFYEIFFPFFLIYASWLILGKLAFGSFFPTTIIAILIGSFIWKFVFEKDKIQLMKLENMLRNIKYNILQ